jgi:hypothetical protein
VRAPSLGADVGGFAEADTRADYVGLHNVAVTGGAVVDFDRESGFGERWKRDAEGKPRFGLVRGLRQKIRSGREAFNWDY